MIRLLTLLMLLLAPLAARTETPPLPAPEGPVVLTVTGAVAVANRDGAAVFDMAMLEALGAETLTTTTPWTEGPQVFEGLPLRRLVERLGIGAGVLRARARNDYAAEIPVSDAVEDGALIAYRVNGAPMPTRGPGPLWIVYPFDSTPDYQSEVVYARAIWQLDRIEAIADPEAAPEDAR